MRRDVPKRILNSSPQSSEQEAIQSEEGGAREDSEQIFTRVLNTVLLFIMFGAPGFFFRVCCYLQCLALLESVFVVIDNVWRSWN